MGGRKKKYADTDQMVIPLDGYSDLPQPRITRSKKDKPPKVSRKETEMLTYISPERVEKLKEDQILAKAYGGTLGCFFYGLAAWNLMTLTMQYTLDHDTTLSGVERLIQVIGPTILGRFIFNFTAKNSDQYLESLALSRVIIQRRALTEPEQGGNALQRFLKSAQDIFFVSDKDDYSNGMNNRKLPGLAA